jgi:hypothetical protein
MNHQVDVGDVAARRTEVVAATTGVKAAPREVGVGARCGCLSVS